MITELEHWRTIDSRGNIMPWYTRSCCAWLDTLDLTDKFVWEYGGGVSTLWYRLRSSTVFGVDSSFEWARLAGILHAPEKQDYICAIQQVDFDLICIDGDYRDECFVYALNHLAPSGVIIIDNWKQESAGWPDWPETERLIKELNLKVTEYPQAGHPDWVTITVQR